MLGSINLWQVFWLRYRKVKNRWAELKAVRVRGQASFKEGGSTLDHILTLCTLVKQEIIACRCLYSCFVDCKKTFDTIMRGKLWKRLQRLGVPPHLQQAIKTMYTTFYTKVRINDDTHHSEVMSDIGVK